MRELLYFSAPWCGPCQTFGPMLERVLQDYPMVQVTKVDIDESLDLGMQYNVRNIPMLVSVGSRKMNLVGAPDENGLRTWLDTLIK